MVSAPSDSHPAADDREGCGLVAPSNSEDVLDASVQLRDSRTLVVESGVCGCGDGDGRVCVV